MIQILAQLCSDDRESKYGPLDISYLYGLTTPCQVKSKGYILKEIDNPCSKLSQIQCSEKR